MEFATVDPVEAPNASLYRRSWALDRLQYSLDRYMPGFKQLQGLVGKVVSL